MHFNPHTNLIGKHAFLSASKYHWLRYNDEKLDESFVKQIAAARGTRLHALAAEAISMRVKLQGRTTMARFVNDAIGFKMNPEQMLFYSHNCFGTADAVSFRNNTLRIHDLKTGESKASMDQLLIYAAIFCLEYRFKPTEINVELRIYQSDEIAIYEPSIDELFHVIDRIVMADKRIDQLRADLED